MASASENTDDDPLPTGWITVSHQDLGVCYVHPVSRACTWSRPRVVDTDRPEEQPMPEDETQLSNAVQMEVQWALRDASERKRDAGEGQQPNDGPLRKPLADPRQQLERELANRPRSSYADFRHKLVPGGDRLMRDAASMLRSYASQMLAARVEVDERPEPGEWPYSPAPTRVSIRLLGVLVGEAVGSGHDIAKKVATESALLTLCPLRWLEELHSIGIGSGSEWSASSPRAKMRASLGWRALACCHRAAPAVTVPHPHMGLMPGLLAVPAQAGARSSPSTAAATSRRSSTSRVGGVVQPLLRTF